jgi:hypothetical protein
VDGVGAGGVDNGASVEDNSDIKGAGTGHFQGGGHMLVGSKVLLEVSENILILETL